MAWANSKGFRQFLADALGNAVAHDLDSDSLLVALYNNTPTPDQNVSAANSAYNAGQWVTANEVSSSGQWAAGGVALSSKVIDVSTNGIVMFDAADTSSGATATLASVYGCLVYDNTLAGKNGICFNYFGGIQGVTSGVFTIQWSTNGILRFTM